MIQNQDDGCDENSDDDGGYKLRRLIAAGHVTPHKASPYEGRQYVFALYDEMIARRLI
jgi:hypothetical protein